jgi:N-acetylglucosaminyl-diphospho-decaprenol L-rhamnosyltransferase
LGLISADFLWAIGRFTFVMRRFLKLGAQGQLTDPAYLSWDILMGDLRALFSSKVWMLK